MIPWTQAVIDALVVPGALLVANALGMQAGLTGECDVLELKGRPKRERWYLRLILAGEFPRVRVPRALGVAVVRRYFGETP